MPAEQSAVLIVARFLKANGYTESYQAFIDEANLSPDAGDASPSVLTLEKLLEEKRLFDQSVNFEKLSVLDVPDVGWTSRAPTTAQQVTSLPSAANLLSTIVTVDQDGAEILLATTSDRRVNTIKLSSLHLTSSWSGVQDSPVLSQLVVEGRYHVSASMSGTVAVAALETGETIEKRKDHAKYVVGVAFYDHATKPLLASAGWDSVVNVYAMNVDSGMLGAPISTIILPTKPESLLFTTNPDTGDAVLVVTRTDSSYLHLYGPLDGSLLGRQNLAPHSNAWVAFTPTSIALHPTDNAIIAVATNSVPHMKLIVVRLLFPRSGETEVEPQTAREQAVMQERIADREHTAIQLHCNTMSSQTPYSTPLVVWRPSGKGVWVNSDDGIIRGIDTLSGKVTSELRYHEPGTKVRALWAGIVREDGLEAERLISGGFDHKLVVWKP